MAGSTDQGSTVVPLLNASYLVNAHSKCCELSVVHCGK